MNDETSKPVSRPPPDADARMKASGETDFARFMRQHQNMVFTTAARLTANDAQAEDIAQDVFVKAYEYFDALRDSPAAPGWLRTVATNLSLNHLQRYRRRWRFFSEFDRDGAEDSADAPPVAEWAAPDTFFDDLERADRRAWVEQALARLPEQQRVPLILFHYENLPYDAIAKKLRVSLAKVKTDIRRARLALGRLLKQSADQP